MGDPLMATPYRVLRRTRNARKQNFTVPVMNLGGTGARETLGRSVAQNDVWAYSHNNGSGACYYVEQLPQCSQLLLLHLAGLLSL